MRSPRVLLTIAMILGSGLMMGAAVVMTSRQAVLNRPTVQGRATTSTPSPSPQPPSITPPSLPSGLDSTGPTSSLPTLSVASTSSSPSGTSLSSTTPALLGRWSSTGGRPFAATSPFNLPLPTNPRLDLNSAALVEHLRQNNHGAAITDYGVPIYFADTTTPRRPVPCIKDWGTCPTAKPVPIPAEAKPSPGSDAAMVIIDWSTRIVYEYWQYQTDKTSWSHAQSIDGDGRHGGAVGAGVSRLAGVVRIAELQAGVIPHALVFSSDMICPRIFRYPASKTDGSNLAGITPCLPEGARIQLDPSVQVDSLPGLTRGERMVARALQRYGAYAIDNGGARMALIMQMPTASTGNPYPSLGLADHQAIRLAWDRLRVLASWNAR